VINIKANMSKSKWLKKGVLTVFLLKNLSIFITYQNILIMKILIPVLIVLFTIASCKPKKDEHKIVVNQEEAKKIIESINQNTKLGNFIVSEDTAKAMIYTFDSLYDRFNNGDIKAFTDYHDMQPCTIESIAAFLTNNKEYDGVQFINVGDTFKNSSTYPDQGDYQNKTLIRIYPTKPPGKPGYTGHIIDTNTTIPYNGCSDGNNFIEKYDKVSTKEVVFENIYRKKIPYTTDEKRLISKSIWIDKTLILIINAIIKSDTKKYVGLRINQAAYLGTPKERLPLGIEKPNQTTIILTILEKSTNGDIKEVFFNKDKLISVFGEKINILSNMNFNHGDLCPKICDEVPPLTTL
jgi:hypothetical protein